MNQHFFNEFMVTVRKSMFNSILFNGEKILTISNTTTAQILNKIIVLDTSTASIELRRNLHLQIVCNFISIVMLAC